MKGKHIYYIHSCVDPLSMHVTRKFHIPFIYIHIVHKNHKLTKITRCLVTCSRSCQGRFSSCVASRTSPSSLARSRYKKTFPQHDNIHQWQTYKCQLLFEWWFFCPPFALAIILQLFWANASCGYNLRKPWGSRKHSIHTRLSLQVAWRTACM